MQKIVIVGILISWGSCLTVSFGQVSPPCGQDQTKEIYDSTSNNYHHYLVSFRLGSVEELSDWSREEIFELWRKDIQLVHPALRKYKGPLVPCKLIHVKIGPIRKNPIVTEVMLEQATLVNYSLPGHFLHPGMVERRLELRDGAYWIVTESWGEGRWPRTNERQSEKVWAPLNEKFQALLKAQSIR